MTSDSPDGSTGPAARLLLVAVLGLAAFWGVHQLQPPPAVAADAPETEFASGRAMRQLGRIAARPHPIGSAEHAKVRESIVAELERLGLEPEIQGAQVIRDRFVPALRAARVQNIVGRIRGTGGGKAVLLVGHYDSVIHAPGATDDGSGVVTLLETLRALQHHPPLANDLIYLFSDGEEFGLLGARAFAEGHPWIDDVGLVLNFEGSGSAGQSLMFETGSGNRWLIDALADVAPFPSASSLSYEIYRRMPNDTDFSVFKERGLPGFNFSCIDNRYDYHTVSDSVANIDERMIAHHGSYALPLTLKFGNLDLARGDGGNAVYFNTIGFGFAHYPESWVLPLNAVVILGFLATVLLGLRAGRLHGLGMLRGLVAFLIQIAVPATVATCLMGGLERWYSGPEWWLLYYNHRPLLLGLACLTVALFAFLQAGFVRRLRPWVCVALLAGLVVTLWLGDLLAWWSILGSVVICALVFWLTRRSIEMWDSSFGALLGWTILTGVVGFAIPGASFLFTWPLAFALIAPAWFFWRGKARDGLPVPQAALLAISAIPAVLWFSGLTYHFYIAMGLQLAGAAMLLVALFLGLLVPHLAAVCATRAFALSGLCALAAVLLVLVSIAGADFDERYRRPSSLFFGFDADTGRSAWYSTDPRPDAWSRSYLGESPATAEFKDFIPSTTNVWSAAAPDADLAPPEVELLDDTRSGTGRTLTLQVRSGRDAPSVNLFFPPGAGIVGARLNGTSIGGLGEETARSDSWWRWRYYAPPVEGFELVLELDSDEPFELRVTDFSYALPDLPALRPRPADTMPAPRSISDMTLTTRGFAF